MKKITDEFKLITDITKNFKKYHQDIIAGIGDDAAVIKNKNNYLLITTDTLVENDHFNLKWCTPQQVGKKSVEVNVSDIAAMGARPTYMLVSLVIKKNTDAHWVKRLYQGMKSACDKYKISLVGGDTTHGTVIMINITLLGKTKKPILRRDAKINDLICVTGQVGGSQAGLKLLRKNKKLPGLLKRKHLEPKARLDVSGIIARFANAMIDVSDGVASEVKHVCQQSKKGAVVWAEKIPVCPGANLKDALSGGEDFELLFTAPQKNLNKLKKKEVDFTVIGKIQEQKNGIYLFFNCNRMKMPGGYDHFKAT